MNDNIIQITRGTPLYIDHQSQTLRFGPSRSLSINTTLFLWLTYQSIPHSDTGLIVNVSLIKKAVRDNLDNVPLNNNLATDLARLCFDKMKDAFPQCRLSRLSLDLSPDTKITLTTENNMIYVTYQYELAASHRLFNPQWSQTENQKHFGKCANPSGHGHNYLLEITLAGTPNPLTGQIAPPDQVHQIISDNIITPFDHKNLNIDSAAFNNLVPTVENMVQVFWNILKDKFNPAHLHCVKVWETSNTFAEYKG